jgi:hypothetical protein
LPVSFAICSPVEANRVEFTAERSCAFASSCGSSVATAIIIPNTVEISASALRPSRTSASRSFLTFGFLGAVSVGSPPFAFDGGWGARGRLRVRGGFSGIGADSCIP